MSRQNKETNDMSEHMIKRLRNILFLMSVLYLSFVVALSVCNLFQGFLVIFPAVVISFLILLCNISSELPSTSLAVFKKHICPIWFFAVVFGFSVFWWLAFFPGDFNLDAYGQWDQAHGISPFSDWHPIVSTLWIKAIISIWDSMPFYILTQIVFFSASCTVMLQTLQHYGVPSYLCLFTAFFIAINPGIGLNTIDVTKDAQFTIVAALLFSCFISIHYSDGEWLKKRKNTIPFAVLLALALLVRHNGVLLVMPALILLFLFYRKYVKRIAESLFLLFLLFVFIKVPVSNTLQVAPHDDPLGEAIGVPMGIMANALIHDSENTPEDVRSFLLNIAPEQDWIDHYYIGEWDSCKWIFDSSKVLKGETIGKILILTWKTIIACPQAAYESFKENTRIVWSVLPTYSSWVPETYVSENDYGIVNTPVKFFFDLANKYISFSLLPGLSSFFWNTGLVIAIVMGICMVLNSSIDVKVLLFTLPLFVFWLGTMLLLAGPNHRYFYLSAVLLFPLISIILHPRKMRMIE